MKLPEEEKTSRDHPLIEGLLVELPDHPLDEWSMESRKKWLEAAAAIFNVIFVSEDFKS